MVFDTPASELIAEYKSFKANWERMLESCEIVEITKFCKPLNINCKVVMNKDLFDIVYPYAEDATGGIVFKQRLEDMFNEMKRQGQFAAIECVNFTLKMETKVKRARAHDKVDTFSDGKARDLSVNVFAGRIVDDRGFPAIIFGISDEK